MQQAADRMVMHRQRLSEGLPLFLIIMSVLAFFGQVIFSTNPLFGSDFALYFFPLKKFIRDHVLSFGTIPLWNPYQFSGTPLITNIQASVFYPLDFLFYMLPTGVAYGYTIILHLILGSVFMYVFVRSLSVNKMGALLSAAIFAYNGFLMAHLYAGHLTLVHSYIWTPLIFLFLHKFLHSAFPKYAILAGLFLGIQILGGFPQIGFYTILGALLYTLYSVCLGPQRKSGQYVARAAIGMGAILVIGFCLAALQLLPTYEFMQLSTRAGGTSYEFATLDSFSPRNFITFLIPDLYGVPANKTFWVSDDSWAFWEHCGYTGICALVLTVVAIRRIVADHVGMFFLLLLVLALFLSLGKHNPLYRFIYYLPGFNHFRIPAQILFLYVFAVAVLAGMGLNHLTDATVFVGIPRVVVLAGLSFLLILAVWSHVHPYSFFYVFFKLAKPIGFTSEQIGQVHTVVTGAILRGTCIFLVIVILLFLYRRGLPSYATSGSLLILISVVDMGSFAFPLVRTVDLEPSPNQAYLAQQLKLDRNIYRAVVNNGCFPENAGLRHQFQDIQGYDPLILKRYVQYVNKSQQLPADDKVVNMHYIRSVDNPLINMLNLKYVVDCSSAE
ncbi:MAG: YfhO family protein, partial [Deltaproteobacteria bacterium]|nr:YfhO family protein [Deltaproteobacteria bacterium]